MALEDLTGASKFLGSLIATNPVATDDRREGDDHIRGIKNVLKNTFPGLNAAFPISVAGGVATLGVPLLIAGPGDQILTIKSLGTGTDDDATLVLDAYDANGEPTVYFRQGGVDQAIIDYNSSSGFSVRVGGVVVLQMTAAGVKVMGGSELPAIDSGTYTPAVTLGANAAAATTNSNATWIRVGNIVSVGLEFTLDPTAASVQTALFFSLPFPSALTTSPQLSGTAQRSVPLGGHFRADAATDTAQFLTTMDTDAANRVWVGNFQYRVM